MYISINVVKFIKQGKIIENLYYIPYYLRTFLMIKVIYKCLNWSSSTPYKVEIKESEEKDEQDGDSHDKMHQFYKNLLSEIKLCRLHRSWCKI